MDKPFNTRMGWARKAQISSPGPEPNVVRPYGPYGGGLYKGNLAGLIIAVGLLIGGLAAIPAARWFFAGSLALGALVGLALWLSHRNKPFG